MTPHATTTAGGRCQRSFVRRLLRVTGYRKRNHGLRTTGARSACGEAFCVADFGEFCVCVACCWAAMAWFAAQVRKRDPQATKSNGDDAPLTQAAFSLRQSASAGCPATETEKITRPRATIRTFRKFNSCLRTGAAFVAPINTIMRPFYIGADEPRLNKFQAGSSFLRRAKVRATHTSTMQDLSFKWRMDDVACTTQNRLKLASGLAST